MTPRLFVRRAARVDIAEAFQWYEARSTGLGHEFLRAVRVAFAAIERAPEQFPVAVDDIRKVDLTRIGGHFTLLGRRSPNAEESSRLSGGLS